MKFFQTFRARLILILAFLLIATLSVQYYVNLQTEHDNEKLREIQEQALVGSVSFVFNSFKYPSKRIRELLQRDGRQFFDENVLESISNIIIIDDKWEVYDSIKEKYIPKENDNGELVSVKLKDLDDLPPISNSSRLGDAQKYFPMNSSVTKNQAHVIPIETYDQGRWYIIVVIRTNKGVAFLKAAQPLIYTLGILLISTLTTILLVWRFTRPIAQLSNAAQQIAEGDFNVRVQAEDQHNELGQLALRFNEMTAELEKKNELEAKLQQAEKSAVVGRLASAIAHEIRNPLNYINLTLDHLRAKFLPEEKVASEQFTKLTAQLKTEVNRINELVSDFLRYSRPMKLELVPTNLHQTIDNSLKIVEAQAAEQGVEINLVEDSIETEILGDGEILRSVFNNLLLMRCRRCRKAGASILQFPDAESIKVEVSDTGTGIKAENLSKIFEPYFSTKETGTGLGLAIVKRIVEEHHGTIEVDSVYGKWTKFVVCFPPVEI